MQKFTIFWVEEEFCYHYYYKSDILYRFFNEYMSNISRMDLLSQFIYVTRVIPYNHLLTHIKRHQCTISISKHENRIELRKGEQTLTLYLDKRFVTIECDSVQEADSILFQSLKRFHPSFFIIEQGSSNSGWITPVKKEVLL
ncbi:sporulation inhibitor of replication protein SirA [Aquibacillus rhizosphaerae]|uniref:Sporulation inhibitor of replication protein SirA n=1 Tax=Aquibacillus rhizosphaerae TaxID=3051431 RepID=A0ABT7L174_9BACI|nr:sporulation inhibitor of replication protein SirA [Aquibacillus sp. LR5S19]MDL4839537.1 sporulation inhibitor of replication protein SirA [Aquibacillus sp. LR5S19]